MRIASIVSAVALMAIATAGSALAAEPFTTLDGVTAEKLSSADLKQVTGSDIEVTFVGVGCECVETIGNPNHGRHADVTITANSVVVTNISIH